MTTVLTVPGMGGWPALQNAWFSAELTTVGNPLPEVLGCPFGPVTKIVGVWYNSIALWGNVNACRNIDSALHDLPPDEQVIVMGHSMGAFGIWTWLRDYAPKSDIKPERILFITTGADDRVKYPDEFLRTSPYRLLDITKQWDEIADPATVSASAFFKQAKSNANALKQHTTGYQGITLGGPHFQGSNGSVNYLFYETSEFGVTGVTRDQVETAYSRGYLNGPVT